MPQFCGVAGNLVTQGIGVATGLQSRFDWAGVAAAGIGNGVMRGLNLPGDAAGSPRAWRAGSRVRLRPRW